MKKICKQTEPSEFTTWKRNNSSCSWDDFVKTNEYAGLKSFLCNEQEGRCCYCEISISGNYDTHIEHHKPKSQYPNDKYNSQNLLASCQHDDSCGHKKGGAYFRGIISPLDDCECRFIYSGNGKIIPNDESDNHANQTINTLGLNCNRLRDLRKSIIKALECCDDQYVADSLNNCNKWFNGFYTVIKQIANTRGAQ